MIAVIAGTRPELIKIAPIYLELKKRGVPSQVWLTGQHESLAEAPLEFFGITPSRHWKTLQPGQGSNVLLSKLLVLLDQAIVDEAPQAIVVQGDTTSALAGALAGFHRQVPVAHVEAGLRTGDLSQPFPEEMNRKVIDSFAQWLFPPTEGARQTLLSEGAKKVEPSTGNTGIDALIWTREKISRLDSWPESIPKYSEDYDVVLSTGHRRENLGEPLFGILRALGEEVRQNPKLVLYHVVHPNPEATRSAMSALNGFERVHLLPALSYPDFVHLLNRSHVVVSDSGGIQEEVPSFGLDILVTRNVTERPEVLECGGHLVGTDSKRLIAKLREILQRPRQRKKVQSTPFGDGKASSRIVQRILNDLSETQRVSL